MTPEELLSARKQALEIIDRLPQRRLVPDERILKWIDIMALREPDRLVWHAVRQGGFSGSEVGTLVTNRRGQRAHFSSARKLVMQKLFMMPPDQPNEHMRRGIETEDLHRIKFMKLWRATRDEQAYDALSNARGRYEFLRYSPDDVVRIERQRILVDYKSPNKVEEESEYNFDYQCQINLGADILQKIGLPCSHGLLSRLDWSAWECKGIWVDIDPALQDEIVEAAHFYWTQHLMRGEPPEFVATHKPADYPHAVREQIKFLSAKVVAIDEVANKLEKEREATMSAMKEVARSAAPAGKATIFSHDLTTVDTVNLDHLRDVLNSRGLDAQAEILALSDVTDYDSMKLLEFVGENPDVDLAQFAKKRVLNVERVLARMAQLGVEVDVVLQSEVDARKSRKKSLADVNAFKPQFTVLGDTVCRELLVAAAAQIGDTQVEEEVDVSTDEEIDVPLIGG